MALFLGVASSIQISEFKSGPDASLATSEKKWVELPDCATAQGPDKEIPLLINHTNAAIATCKGPPKAEEEKKEEKKEGPKPLFDPIQTAKKH